MSQAITVSYACCGVIFCVGKIPDAYTSTEFMRELRKYAKRPDLYKIETVELGKGNITFNKCSCKEKKQQQQLF